MIPLYKPKINKRLFNKYINIVNKNNKYSCYGEIHKLVQQDIIDIYGENIFLTNSGTSSMDIIAKCLNISNEDEILVQSFTFSTTASPFLTYTQKINFIDTVNPNCPYVSLNKIKEKITKKTKVIIINHYAGIATEEIEDIACFCKESNIILIEDNAHGFLSKYNNKLLGTFGDFGIISFHDAKLFTAGAGGIVIFKDPKYAEDLKSKINKGTNFDSDEAKKNGFYKTIGVGGAYGLTELNCALLKTQLDEKEKIIELNKKKWLLYYNYFIKHLKESIPFIPENQEQNYSMFYLVAKNLDHRNYIISEMKKIGITASFHYYPLHMSECFGEYQKECDNSRKNYEVIFRLPIFNGLTKKEQLRIINSVIKIYNEENK